jgi:hypothetical protein
MKWGAPTASGDRRGPVLLLDWGGGTANRGGYDQPWEAAVSGVDEWRNGKGGVRGRGEVLSGGQISSQATKAEGGWGEWRQ